MRVHRKSFWWGLTLLVIALLGFVVPAMAACDATWYTGWSYRQSVAVEYQKVAANKADMVILISLPIDQGLAAHAQPSGNDILFTSGDGKTKIPHKIMSYASANGALKVLLKIPVTRSSSKSLLYMYYGNPAAPSQQAASVTWNYNIKGKLDTKTAKAWTWPKDEKHMKKARKLVLGSEISSQACSPDPTPTVPPVDPTPTPTLPPTFSCSEEMYPLVNEAGEIAGCVAMANDWTWDPSTGKNKNMLSVSFTMADSYCLTGTDVGVSSDENTPAQATHWSLDPAACTTAHTFTTDLPVASEEVYVSISGTVKKVPGGKGSGEKEFSVLDSPIDYLIMGEPPTPTPTPTPVPFSCPSGSYSLVTAGGETAGCVALTDNKDVNNIRTLFGTFTAAGSTRLTAANVGISTTLTSDNRWYSQVFDPASGTTSYTFAILLPWKWQDVQYLYVTPTGTVQRVADGGDPAGMAVSVPGSPIYYIFSN